MLSIINIYIFKKKLFNACLIRLQGPHLFSAPPAFLTKGRVQENSPQTPQFNINNWSQNTPYMFNSHEKLRSRQAAISIYLPGKARTSGRKVRR